MTLKSMIGLSTTHRSNDERHLQHSQRASRHRWQIPRWILPLILRVRAAAVLAWITVALVFSLSSSAFTDILVPGNYPTIQQAIDNASPGDVIIVSPGVWVENVTIPALVELTIRSTDPHNPAIVESTIIDGGGSGSTITCTSPLPGDPFHLHGMTVTGGSAVNGGGMYCQNRYVDIQLCVFTNNHATSDGGAIFITGNGSPVGEGLAVENSHFRPDLNGFGNRAGDGGGAVYVSNTPAEFIRCHFEENEAVTGGALEIADLEEPSGLTGLTAVVSQCDFLLNVAGTGGAIYSVKSGLKVDFCSFILNEASFGGAVEIDRNFLAELSDSAFLHNDAEYDGGAIETSISAVFIDDCQFEQNSAAYGGAIEFFNETDVMLTKCIFRENRAGCGGAILQNGQWSGTMAVTKCIFTDNRAAGIDFSEGGAVVAQNLHMTNCEFVGNSTTDTNPMPSTHGGAINLWGSTRIANCRFRGNSADLGSAINIFGNEHIDIVNCTFSQNTVPQPGSGTISCAGGISQISNCIVWGNNDGIQNFAGTTTVEYCDVQGGYAGAGNFDLDPLFVNPSLGNFRLMAGSPCIDAGNDLLVPEDFNDLDMDGDVQEFMPLDLDELPRFQGTIDMGVYERQ